MLNVYNFLSSSIIVYTTGLSFDQLPGDLFAKVVQQCAVQLHRSRVKSCSRMDFFFQGSIVAA